MDALKYKIQNDPYYANVIINIEAIDVLTNSSTHVSNIFLHCVDQNFKELQLATTTTINYNDGFYEHDNSLSFIPKLPNPPWELHDIKQVFQFEGGMETIVPWPKINSSPINEYNSEGLFCMAFPTLFPIGIKMPLQPRTAQIHLHE